MTQANEQTGAGAAAGVRPVPEGYRTVTPWIISKDTAGLLDYLRAAFGGVELARVPNPDGSIGHAEMRIGDSIVMFFDAKEGWPATPGFLRLFVEDADAVYARAIQAGGSAVTKVTELFFGDRVGRIRDPVGNIWWIQTHVADLGPAEMGSRAGEPRFADAMREVQDSLDRELRRHDRNPAP
jgi:PhnB protein